MAGRKNTNSIEDKILKAQENVIKTKEKYDEAVAALEELYAKRDAIKKDELMKMFTKSNRTYEEVMEFLKGDMPDEETESRPKRGRKPRKRI